MLLSQTLSNALVVGLQVRYDNNTIDRKHTAQRIPLPYCEEQTVSGSAQSNSYNAIGGNCTSDQVQLLDVAPYLEATTRWTPWLRTVLGVREDYYYAHDRSAAQLLKRQTLPVNSAPGLDASKHQTLFQPKGNLILGPWAKTEFYFSIGRGFHSDDVRGVLGTVPVEGFAAAAGPTPLLARTSGAEVGFRTNIIPHLSIQVAAFQQDFLSELRYDQDQGQDQGQDQDQDTASAPSRRQGVEASAQYKPVRWIELNTDLSFAKARYCGSSASLASFGLAGAYIADAPKFIGSIGVLVDNLGAWSGGLQWRVLGPSPLLDGPARPEDAGYSEVNFNIGRRFNQGLKALFSIYNLGNSHQDAAAYFYTSRLPGEPAAGVAGLQSHPLETRSVRVTLSKTF